MNVVLDHIFVMCDRDAPEAAALEKIGLAEGPGNTHPGQGTACRRFFFAQQYLELLWVGDEREARSNITAPTRLWDRWSNRSDGACPFGLVFARAGGEPAEFAVPTWNYRPAYLSGDLAIEIADTPIDEPGVFYLPFVRTGSNTKTDVERSMTFGAITHLRLGTPAGALRSPALRWAESTGLLSVKQSNAHVLTITFGNATRNRADLRPTLPLIFEW